MQEIKKRRIVIASILKPVTDTRMTEKLACSLAKEFEVQVIGFPQPSQSIDCPVKLHTLDYFKRLSINRLFAKWEVFSKVRTIHPDFLVITTHELLLPAVLLKLFFRVRIIYDVQENYYRNILFTPAFPKLVRPILAGYVRMKEWFARPWIEKFILAEAGYRKELAFVGNRNMVIENKLKRPVYPVERRSGNGKHLVFTGTLAESTGVYLAIELANLLYEKDSSIRLTIAGYASRHQDLVRIQNLMKDKPFIQLVGGDKLVPHAEILQLIRTADYGIISYPPNPSTVNSIPTKLYEYLGCRLPFLLLHHPPWSAMASKYQAAILFPRKDPNAVKILSQMHHANFYIADPEDVYWESEEKKVLALFRGLSVKN